MLITIIAAVATGLLLAAYDLNQKRKGGRPLIGFFSGRMQDLGYDVRIFILRVGSWVLSIAFIPHPVFHFSTESIETWKADQE